jgi:hypothetical protein
LSTVVIFFSFKQPQNLLIRKVCSPVFFIPFHHIIPIETLKRSYIHLMIVYFEVQIFFSEDFSPEDGVETEEMRPQWFSMNSIPFDSMWADDRLWLPTLLRDRTKKVKGFVEITMDEKHVEKYDIKFEDM